MRWNNISLLLIILIFSVSCSKKPDGFVVFGEFTGFPDSTILYLEEPGVLGIIDSSYILNGRFQFKGFVNQPQRLYVRTKYTNEEDFRNTSFFVENSEIQVRGDYSNFQNCVIKGSESQEIENILVEKVKSLNSTRDSLIGIYYGKENEITEEEKGNLIYQINRIDSLTDIQYLWFIKKYINSYPALEKLKWRMADMPKDTLQKFYNLLSDEFKNSGDAKSIKTYIDSRLVEIGEPFIDFEAVDINGNPFKLSDVKKDYILLDFWSVGCAPCRKANIELARNYHVLEKNLEIVSFSLDIKRDWIVEASAKDSICWTNITDYNGQNSVVAVQYRISGIPCSYLINKERIVIKRYLGYSPDMIESIQKAMNES